jgi:hypothetical protein
MMLQESSGVVVRPELCAPLLRAAVVGAAKQQRDDGGAPPDAGFLALLRQLQAVAELGRAPVTVTAEPRQLTVAEAAPVMGVSPRRVRQLAAERSIIARKAGWYWLVDERSAQQWRNR